MAALRRGNLCLLLIYAVALAIAEYAIVTYAVLPMPSTRLDWWVATGFIAPMGTAILLLMTIAAIRIVADILALLRRAERWITTTLSSRPADPTPSSSTPSAAPQSSSYGWPSGGSSFTSHRGKEGHWP